MQSAKKRETQKEKSFGWTFLEALPKGSTIHTVMRSVSRSGMSRVFDVFIITGDHSPLLVRRSVYHGEKAEPRLQHIFVQEDINCAKDHAQEQKWGGNYKMTGCGMDMGFALVYGLGQLIHNDGYYFEHHSI